MKKAIITLKDGRQFEYENEYIWGHKDELNNMTLPFIEIGNLTLRKDEISSVEIINLESELEEGENKNE